MEKPKETRAQQLDRMLIGKNIHNVYHDGAITYEEFCTMRRAENYRSPGLIGIHNHALK